MPIYGFTCGRCGGFEVMRPMSRAAAAEHCPECGGEAERVFSPPGIALLRPGIRAVRDREERSGHEPDVVATKRGRPLPHRHQPTPSWAMSHH